MNAVLHLPSSSHIAEYVPGFLEISCSLHVILKIIIAVVVTPRFSHRVNTERITAYREAEIGGARISHTRLSVRIAINKTE